MTFSAVDEYGKFTPEFAAFTKLTVVNHVLGQLGILPASNQQGRTSMSFQDFMEAIQKNEVVNPGYARKLPQHEIRHSHFNAHYNGNHAFERTRLDIIAKAYELGMVDANGLLLSSFSRTV